MVPIKAFEDGDPIGYTLNEFLIKFTEICDEHSKEGRAQKFAFLFYDENDKAMKEILKEGRGSFTLLDRLAGKYISIFYFIGHDQNKLQDFNEIFRKSFKIKDHISYPFLLLFNIGHAYINVPVIIELNRVDIKYAFQELYSTLEKIIEEIKKSRPEPDLSYYQYLSKTNVVKTIKWVGNKVASTLITETIKQYLK
jgi:hypothetical protein